MDVEKKIKYWVDLATDNLQARYPDDKADLYKSLSDIKITKIYNDTSEFHKWLIQLLKK